MDPKDREAVEQEVTNWAVECIAVRWYPFKGTTWPLPAGQNYRETIDSHVEFLYKELRRLRAKAGEPEPQVT